ncbi:hypothetical protein CSOJ01_03941 [Colletotrichum sojae]|uniref:Uncharacterized protein n=1 Tax=Colletotrichum sojae TaxID=2175907 RepID=A0A8H6JLE8_9PEZI|nr:hypothetical protein CSOJ01_03941 [Colletotrichum sojae]
MKSSVLFAAAAAVLVATAPAPVPVVEQAAAPEGLVERQRVCCGPVETERQEWRIANSLLSTPEVPVRWFRVAAPDRQHHAGTPPPDAASPRRMLKATSQPFLRMKKGREYGSACRILAL